ncbi:MAG: diacylglycerol/polyprenol kinase family protein [Candidatus Saccharibacteria bacterium]
MALVFTIVAVLLVLLLAEYLARHTNMHAELTRKFVHMLVGTFVAFWPYFLSWRQIELLSLAMFIVILVSVKFTIFKAIHTTPSRVFGEISFAMVIGILALISSSKWIFMAAMLNLSIGDALAAIIGVLKGEHNQYKVFGKTKSIAGTATFFIVSVAVMMLYVNLSRGSASFTTLFVVPILATVTENVAVNGTDNLIMPVLIALILGGAA